MSPTAAPPVLPSPVGGPTYEVTACFPKQGRWSERKYLDLCERSPETRLELVDGQVVLLPLPTRTHQILQGWLASRLTARCGFANVLTNGYKLRLPPRPRPDGEPDYRLPDVLASVDGVGFGEAHATAATLVVEIVSDAPSDRERDLVEKRRDYAEAGVPEYWVVDPRGQTVLQLVLDGDAYREAGTFGAGQTFVSAAVEGVTVPVDELFAAVAAV